MRHATFLVFAGNDSCVWAVHALNSGRTDGTDTSNLCSYPHRSHLPPPLLSQPLSAFLSRACPHLLPLLFPFLVHVFGRARATAENGQGRQQHCPRSEEALRARAPPHTRLCPRRRLRPLQVSREGGGERGGGGRRERRKRAEESFAPKISDRFLSLSLLSLSPLSAFFTGNGKAQLTRAIVTAAAALTESAEWRWRLRALQLRRRRCPSLFLARSCFVTSLFGRSAALVALLLAPPSSSPESHCSHLLRPRVSPFHGCRPMCVLACRRRKRALG